MSDYLQRALASLKHAENFRTYTSLCFLEVQELQRELRRLRNVEGEYEQYCREVGCKVLGLDSPTVEPECTCDSLLTKFPFHALKCPCNPERTVEPSSTQGAKE